MSRKLKYGEPTKTVGFKVPLSKVDDVRKYVDEHLKIYIHSAPVNNESDIMDADVYKNNKASAKYISGTHYPCNCRIENNLLIRPKNSKCKLTKSEH